MPAGLFVGICTVDIAYVVASFPPANRKITAECQELAAGGPATNAAVTFSFLGGAAHLVTAVGKHPLAGIVRQDLGQHRVRLTDIAADRPQPPPVSSAFIDAATGERTVVSAGAAVYQGLRYRFDPAWLAGVDILLVDGHHMPLCVAAAAAARGAGIPVVLDGGSWKDGMPDLLAHVDIAVCSADFVPPGQHALAGVAALAVTRGSDSVLWRSGDRRGEIPVPQITPKDTLGAGDIFHGAFCWALASGQDLESSLSTAAKVASQSCLHYGTRRWMETT